MRAEENTASVRDDFTRAAERKRKRRTGPPPTKPLTIRLSDDERDMLAHEAGKLSLSAHIRRKLLNDSVSPRRGKGLSRKPPVPKVDHVAVGKALALLGRSELSRRLDEVATAAIMGALPLGPELIQELHAACAHIRAIRAALMDALNVQRGFEE